MKKNIKPDEFAEVTKCAKEAAISISTKGDDVQVHLNGKDVSEEIRSPEVNEIISVVAANPEVRNVLIGFQRSLGKRGGIVAEGRDIGTVVFPNADLKFFFTASLDKRVQRRGKDYKKQMVSTSSSKLADELAYRDKKDQSREHAPLRKADDAIEIDTSDLTIEQQVAFVMEKIRISIRSK